MKHCIFLIFYLLTFVFSHESYDSDSNDDNFELPLENQKFLACVILKFEKYENDKENISKLLKEIKINQKEGKRKIKAIMVANCMEKIPENMVSPILEADDFENLDSQYFKYVEINYEELKSKSFNWTLSQYETEILKAVKEVFFLIKS